MYPAVWPVYQHSNIYLETCIRLYNLYINLQIIYLETCIWLYNLYINLQIFIWRRVSGCMTCISTFKYLPGDMYPAVWPEGQPSNIYLETCIRLYDLYINLQIFTWRHVSGCMTWRSTFKYFRFFLHIIDRSRLVNEAENNIKQYLKWPSMQALSDQVTYENYQNSTTFKPRKTTISST